MRRPEETEAFYQGYQAAIEAAGRPAREEVFDVVIRLLEEEKQEIKQEGSEGLVPYSAFRDGLSSLVTFIRGQLLDNNIPLTDLMAPGLAFVYGRMAQAEAAQKAADGQDQQLAIDARITQLLFLNKVELRGVYDPPDRNGFLTMILRSFIPALFSHDLQGRTIRIEDCCSFVVDVKRVENDRVFDIALTVHLDPFLRARPILSSMQIELPQ